MINFVLALGMMGIVLGGGTCFLIWVLREHLIARKYRYLIRLHRQMGPQTPIYNVGPQWKVTYKEKGKLKTMLVPGSTEEEAMKKAWKEHSIDLTKLIEVVKV